MGEAPHCMGAAAVKAAGLSILAINPLVPTVAI